MSREQGEILHASLHPVYGCVSFPRKVSDSSSAELEIQEPDTSPWKVSWLVFRKQLGTQWISQHKIHQHAALIWYGWVTRREHCPKAWKCLHLRFSFPVVTQRGREMVEIAKPFLLFTLFFSCLNPAGTVDDEHSASFLSDQLLSGIATRGGSFLGKMSRDKGHTQLLLLRVLLSS